MQTQRGCGETAQGQGTNHSGRNRAKQLGVAEMTRYFQKSRLHSGYDWVQGLVSARGAGGTSGLLSQGPSLRLKSGASLASALPPPSSGRLQLPVRPPEWGRRAEGSLVPRPTPLT